MIPLLIDTDVALGVHHDGRPRDIDDAFAIVEASNSPGIDLLGVSTVFGNAPLTDVDAVARAVVDLKQSAVPVTTGAATPLPPDGTLPDPNDAVIALARQLKAQPCHIAAIGPLTNIGLLIGHFPGVIMNIESIVIVAGRSPANRFFIGDTGPVADFNFENDVRAAGIVMSCGRPIVLAGFELTSQVVVTEQDLETIRDAESETASYFYENSRDWCRYWTGQFPQDRGFHPWDSAAISWFKHPDYFTTERRGWRVQRDPQEKVPWLECSARYPGDTITYCTGFSDGGAARFVEDIVSNVY